MAEFQTTLQDSTARIKGSGVLYVMAYDSAKAIALAAGGADGYSWTNVGSITGLNLTENMTATQLQGDNAEEEKYVSEQTITVGFDQREPALEDVRAIIRGSFDTKVTTAGSLVSGATQTIASGGWSLETFIKIENQNGDGSAITVNSVTGGTDGALTDSTDYFVGQNGAGEWGIFISDDNASTNITTAAQSLEIDYDYTPTASARIYSGGKTTLPYFMWKIVNTDENDKLLSIYGYKAAMDQGYSFTYKADSEADPVVPNAVQFTSIQDNSITTTGKKLFFLYQERGL